MEKTLHDLAGILLKGIPTVVIILLLHFYLKSMLFTPLAKVLKQRDDLTAGARKAAQASLEAAERKAAEYENAIRDARSEVYKDQEQARAKLVAAQEARLAEARERMSAMIKSGKAQIEQEAAAARQGLTDHTSALADQITDAVLSGRAS
jgi:F-type H+-transporting ATPase subunit b